MELDKATKIFRENYKKWLNNEKRNSSGYEYERSFVEQVQKMEKELFQDSVGEVPVRRNLKKKSRPRSGR
jgi:predicted acetyltransferase